MGVTNREHHLLLGLFGPRGRSRVAKDKHTADAEDDRYRLLDIDDTADCYFRPSKSAYLSPPWDSASPDECREILDEIRRSSGELRREYLQAHYGVAGRGPFERALESVFAEAVYGSNHLEGVGLGREDTAKACTDYLRGDITERDLEEVEDKQGYGEVVNHVRAFLFLAGKVRENGRLERGDLFGAHGILLGGDYSECQQHGRYRTTHCVVGSTPLRDAAGEEIATAAPESIGVLMGAWLEKYNSALAAGLDQQEPVYASSVLAKSFLEEHPFKDGNGRLVRILENVLVSHHYPFVLVPHGAEGNGRARRRYMQTVRAAIKKDRPGFLAYRSLKGAVEAVRKVKELAGAEETR